MPTLNEELRSKVEYPQPRKGALTTIITIAVYRLAIT